MLDGLTHYLIEFAKDLLAFYLEGGRRGVQKGLRAFLGRVLGQSAKEDALFEAAFAEGLYCRIAALTKR